MPLQKRQSGTAKEKRNCWIRGAGIYSFRGELKRGISLNKKRLNRRVRHSNGEVLKNADYRKVSRTTHMVDFS